jgi:predicted metal-binding protein
MEIPSTTANEVTLFVCISCRGAEPGEEGAGRALFAAVTAELGVRGACGISVVPIECLSVCKRPCTVAFAGPGKWGYVIGDLNPEEHAGDIIATALQHAATENGIIPWRQRPLAIRRGVVARVPPIGFRPDEPGA